MGFISTLFIGILSIQTAVNSSADTLSVKTAKFIVGSTVPVAGGVLAEALTTVTASLNLLKSSVGIWGVLICALTFLPLVIELLLWRVCLWGLAFFGDTFSLSKISNLLKSVDSVLSVLVGIVLLSFAMFTISLTVVILGGKAV
jgi:stage III sporulation protein AE